MKRAVYIVAGRRTPFVKSFTSYKGKTTNELMEIPLRELVASSGLQGVVLGDVALGAVMNSSRNWNLARECVLSSGLSADTPAYNVQRACGTSLEATMQIYAKIALGFIDVGIAGGVDTNSDAPVEIAPALRDKLMRINQATSMSTKLKEVAALRLSDFRVVAPAVTEPRTKLSMGEHCELMVKTWQIGRREQDELSLASHRQASEAYREGFYRDWLTPVNDVERDGFVRDDSSLDKLAKLKPVFDREHGTITAGNASPLTDGAACVLLAADQALKEYGWQPLARLVDFQTAAVDFVAGSGLLMAPTKAVADMLKRNNLQLQDFDYYEVHEAFAGQVLCTLKAWESAQYCREILHWPEPLGAIDRNKMNLKGGSVALGHPFAATGARILTTLAKQIHARPGRGLISICTAGGMGVAAIVEGV